MIRLGLLFLFLVLGLITGPQLIGQKGYVLIAADKWTIEMSLVSFALSMFMAVALFLGAEWLLKKVIGLITGSHQWLGSWSNRRHQKNFTLGLVALDEGDHESAHKYLSSVDHGLFSGISILALAQANKHLGQSEEAINLWQQAQEYTETDTAAKLHIAANHIKNKQETQALELLDKIDKTQDTKPQEVRLRLQALSQCGQWIEIKHQLKGWKKKLDKQEYDYWMQQASQGELAEVASKSGAIELKNKWQEKSRTSRKDPAQQAAYIEQLIAQNMFQDAEQLLVTHQKKVPDPLLLPLFKKLKLPNPSASIKKLESWLKHDENNVQLLSALGHLAYHANDFQLADNTLSKAIKLGDQREDKLLLATIKEEQNDNQQAMKLYKQSL